MQAEASDRLVATRRSGCRVADKRQVGARECDLRTWPRLLLPTHPEDVDRKEGTPVDDPKKWHLEWKQTEVQGGRANYGEAGSGTPFLFLHGWGLRDRTYQRALSRVARLGVRVVVPSMPGFGDTAPLRNEHFSMQGYADWVADFAKTVGITEDYYLAGHSFGGGVAIKVAHDHGENCRLLVLVNSIGGAVWKEDAVDRSPSRYLSERPIWDWGIHFPRDVARRRLFNTVLPVVLQDAARNVLRDPIGFWRVGAIARRANLLSELEELKRRELPVVVLWGNEDAILPAASLDAIVAAVGQRAEVVEGAHSWLLADPDRFGEVMTNVVAVAEQARRMQAEPDRRQLA
jgi:pimeloyl-ACP methyl ester carboxylesterase